MNFSWRPGTKELIPNNKVTTQQFKISYLKNKQRSNVLSDLLLFFFFCVKNKQFISKFVGELEYFANNRYDFTILENKKHIIYLKYKTNHMSSFLCKRGCDCGEKYVGETLRNVKSVVALE